MQDLAEFTVQHLETEGYVKKLLAAQNIELPSISFNQSSGSSRSHSNTSSTACPPKSVSRGSVHGSIKGSIGHVVNIEPEFDRMLYKDLNIIVSYHTL